MQRLACGGWGAGARVESKDLERLHRLRRVPLKPGNYGWIWIRSEGDAGGGGLPEVQRAALTEELRRLLANFPMRREPWMT